MYSEFFIIRKEKPIVAEKSQKLTGEDHLMSTIDRQQEVLAQNEIEMARLADRVLLLLSFKDTPTQNLQTVLHVLGIQTLEEKQRILREIFRLIREGIVYIPRGLPLLIENGLDFDQIKDVDLRLLQPYDHLIQEIQDQIAKLQVEFEP
ncbi:MAG: hypothetical protein ACFE95_21685 [Candidatus Hodarchaeota archaeon]